MGSEASILIIDDEEIVLDSCIQILAGSDYVIATAENGTLGLEKLEEFQPDLVFVDLKMPGISGLEVLEHIHSIDPTIVTIVITGFATVSSAVDAMKRGAYDFLPKPFTPDEFRLITRRGVERRKLVLETIALRREKEMLRQQFAAIISHELKAPLGAVQQNLFLLKDELANVLSEDQQFVFERIQSRISDLINMIHTWLRVTSTDLDAIKDQFKPIDLSSVVSKAVDSVQPHAIRKNIEIDTSLEGSLGLVYGEEGTLAESIVNITNNAIKYSHMGSTITIKVFPVAEDNVISISDRGLGISPEDLPYIFDDFYRGKFVQNGEKGSGLGLAISKRIIDIHNGSISVESELGKGSIFVIKLPVYESDPHSSPQVNDRIIQ